MSKCTAENANSHRCVCGLHVKGEYNINAQLDPALKFPMFMLHGITLLSHAPHDVG